MPARPGPDLPYKLVAGVIPCVPGWLVASAKLHGATFAPELPKVLETFVEVLDERPSFDVVALNAPIGYVEKPDGGLRLCDREARALLGRRGSTVHNAPSWAHLKEDAELTDHLDAVSVALLPRYREVAAEMAPYRQRTVYSVHPELSFFQINNDVPLRWTKRFEAGREERRAILEKRIPGIDRVLDFELDVPFTHKLDAAALMWTARRIYARAGTRLPADPEWDEEGLRMEFVR
jgi:predicted RNase H-like nuclease